MKKFSLFCMVMFLASCSAAFHQNQPASTQKRDMPVGIAQNENHGNMGHAATAEPLGSPIPVTKDKMDNGTWNHDKIAEEAANSNGSVSQADKTGEVGGKKLLLLKLFFN